MRVLHFCVGENSELAALMKIKQLLGAQTQPRAPNPWTAWAQMTTEVGLWTVDIEEVKGNFFTEFLPLACVGVFRLVRRQLFLPLTAKDGQKMDKGWSGPFYTNWASGKFLTLTSITAYQKLFLSLRLRLRFQCLELFAKTPYYRRV